MISRRRLLHLGGLTALGAVVPDTPLLASGQPPTPPRRLIVVSHCHGWPYTEWRMRPTGASDEESWTLGLGQLDQAAFSRPLVPLYEHRHRLLVLDGLSLATAELDTGGNRHDRGWVHAWTGNNANFATRDTRSLSASVDQLIAAHIASPHRLPSLELSVDAALEAGRPISYSPSGMRLPAENTPLRAWERVFGPASSGDVVGTHRRATLEFAYQEYRELAPRLPTNERARLESHYGLVERLGRRLEGLATLSCEPPRRSAAAFEQYDERFDAFVDIIAAAFSCDITRVVSLSLGEMPTTEFGADHISDKVHKGIAHYIYDDPVKHTAMTNYIEHHARQVARLIRTLEQIPDADGHTVMDNTLIVWGSELGDGWHGYNNYCPVLIGGSWAFKTGRYLRWPHRTPAEMRVPSQFGTGGTTQVSGTPHQHLLVSIARAMGLGLDHVGLHHVRGQRGDYIDVSGPLPGLVSS
ncbi:MAG: DUF1552 domain-containing protein [Acidobacteriota bacterium]|nr:DUF1552 domain-containing protein [Acidobacteriota bacterium]